MSNLKPEEIYVGLVYSFVSGKISSDPNIKMISQTTTDSVDNRPFVCIAIEGDDSLWAEVSTQKKTDGGGGDLRLEILPEWKKTENNFVNKWCTADQYIHGCLYKGPSSSFCLTGNDILEKGKRRFVTKDGVKNIRKFFSEKKGISISEDDDDISTQPDETNKE